MKTQFISFAIMLFSNTTFSQQEPPMIYQADTIIVDKNVDRINTESVRFERISARLIDNAESGRIYFNPKLALTDAQLDLVDEYGEPWLSHSFAVLSDLDISVKNLPQGSYELVVRSEQGRGSMSFYKD